MPTISNAQYTYTVEGWNYFNLVSGWTNQSTAYGTTYGPSQSPGYTVEAPVEDKPKGPVIAPPVTKTGK